jgi:hypothetical protein
VLCLFKFGFNALLAYGAFKLYAEFFFVAGLEFHAVRFHLEVDFLDGGHSWKQKFEGVACIGFFHVVRNFVTGFVFFLFEHFD